MHEYKRRNQVVLKTSQYFKNIGRGCSENFSAKGFIHEIIRTPDPFPDYIIN